VKLVSEENKLVSWWPRTGDTLFASGLDWEAEAQVGWSSDSLLAYAIGYKDAADLLVASVEARNIAADLAVYPICFLYRHHIELMLKGLIRLAYSLQSSALEYPKNHKIEELWRTYRPLLEEACPDRNQADTDTVEKCIIEFASLDPSGEAFRYAEDKKGASTFPKITQFNLGNMREVMNRLSGFLTGSFDYMDELLQHQADMYSEY